LNYSLSDSHGQSKDKLVKDMAKAESQIVQVLFQKHENETDEDTHEVKVYKPSYPILQKFEESKGMSNLINVAIAVVDTYVDEKQKNTWKLWLNELKSFLSCLNSSSFSPRTLKTLRPFIS
jgi:hypothetical protein